MSTERIDHAARAVELLNWQDTEDGRTTITWDIKTAALIVRGAQVHATLALVEQQRIANLIAYAADVDVIRSGNYDLNLEIRKALGL